MVCLVKDCELVVWVTRLGPVFSRMRGSRIGSDQSLVGGFIAGFSTVHTICWL